MAAGYAAEEAKQRGVAVSRRKGKDAEAIRLSDTLAVSPRHAIMRADLRVDPAPAEAREIPADRGFFTGRQDILGRGLAIVESFIKEKDFGAALAEASQLEAALPDHPQGPLAHFRVKNARGDEDIHADLDRALALVGEDTDFPTRFLVAEGPRSVQRFDEVVDILYQKTPHRFDSPAFRGLLAA